MVFLLVIFNYVYTFFIYLIKILFMKKILFCVITGMAAININAQVSLTATAGTTTGTFTTLKGAFDAINVGTHQGAITINITSNTTETATATLNANGGTVVYTSVLIKPSTGTIASISGSIDSAPLVRVLGSNVTIDGSNTINGTTKDLTFTNTSTTAPQVLTFIGASAATANTNIVVKNSNIINGTNTSSALVFFDGAATPIGGYFNNVTIQNNSIKKAYIGIYLFGAIAAGNGTNTLVTGNDLSSTGAESIRLAGIYLQSVDGGTVSNNTIGNFNPAAAEIRRGIWFATGTVNSSAISNTITNLNYSGTGAGGAAGITVTSGNTGSSPAANVILRGNTISNFTSTGTGTVFSGIYVGGTLTNAVTIDRNKINTITNTNTSGYGANGLYIASTSAVANMLVTNNIISGVSGYGYVAGGGVNDNGNGIVIGSGGGYRLYYNTVVMNANQTVSGRSSALNVISTVTAAGAIDLRNNIFVNSQTQAGEKYVLYSGSANTVFSNINYNNYFSSGTNLGFIGGAAKATLADIQTSFGGNINSYNVLPEFASATDFHIPAATNAALDNKATPIAEVTLDADGNVRSAATPDLGGYEFSATLAVQDADKGVKISYYPNPVTDYLYASDVNKITSVEVYNTAGQRISTIEINAMKGSVDMSNLPSGIYFVKFNSEKASQNVKIIKK